MSGTLRIVALFWIAISKTRADKGIKRTLQGGVVIQSPTFAPTETTLPTYINDKDALYALPQVDAQVSSKDPQSLKSLWKGVIVISSAAMAMPDAAVWEKHAVSNATRIWFQLLAVAWMESLMKGQSQDVEPRSQMVTLWNLWKATRLAVW